MSFTPEEIEIMDKEVEEDMDDQELEASVFDTDDKEECGGRTRHRDSDSDDSNSQDGTCN